MASKENLIRWYKINMKLPMKQDNKFWLQWEKNLLLKKRLLFLPIIFIWVNVQGQVNFGLFSGYEKYAILGVQSGYNYKGFYLNGNLIIKTTDVEPPQAEIRLNYTKLRLSPYIGVNRELWAYKGDKAKQDVRRQTSLSYGLQWQGRRNDDALFNRLDRLFVSMGVVGKSPMVIIGGIVKL